MTEDTLTPWPPGRAPAEDMCGEEDRLRILSTYGLDTLQDDPELTEITRFAARLCGTPISMVTLVEEERQRFLARSGTDETETPRPTSFCAHAMLGAQPLVVPDTREDPTFRDNPLVTGDPHIRFYAGAPLISHEGAPLGSLCVVDTEPHPDGLTEMQLDGLQVLAASVMRRLRTQREFRQRLEHAERSRGQLEALANSIPDIAWSTDSEGRVEYFNDRWYDFTGGTTEILDTQEYGEYFHPEDRSQWDQLWQEHLKSGDPYEAEFRIKRADGEYRWMLGRGVPVKRANGHVEKWFGTITDIDDAHRRLDAREMVTRELSHRIKNIFAVVSGLMAIKGRDWPESRQAFDDVSKTLDALGRAHGYVTQDTARKGETLHGILRALLAPYGDVSGHRLKITGQDVPVDAKSATPLALVYHELATNSAKYGAFSVAEGRVTIETGLDEGKLTVEWTESGGPPVSAPEGVGFGSRLVEMTVRNQLRGSLDRRFEEEGLVARLELERDRL
ncbi:PAS domain-containing protein [Qipengyuania sp. JC766]|uniref:sensor histidine kinase n=1 Tax=Qipengyuania sp. JC766 TaxID=3232139 RepID=UPI0034577B3C